MAYRPKTGEKVLEEPPLSLEVSYYSKQQLDARSSYYFNEQQRILRKLKHAALKASKHIMTPGWTYSYLVERFSEFHLRSRPHEPVAPLFVPLQVFMVMAKISLNGITQHWGIMIELNLRASRAQEIK